MGRVSTPLDMPRLLADVGSPTVSPQGTTGSTSWSYQVVGVVDKGHQQLRFSAAAAAGTTATGNATLDETNFNRVTWTDVSGYSYYLVYRTAAGGTPSSTGLIGRVEPGVQELDDTGLELITAEKSESQSTPSASNTTDNGKVESLEMFKGDLDVAFEGYVDGTFHLEGSYRDGGTWTQIGADITADRVDSITAKYTRLRLRNSVADTGATPVAMVAGDDR